jgi:hypothetical protein
MAFRHRPCHIPDRSAKKEREKLKRETIYLEHLEKWNLHGLLLDEEYIV